MYGPSPRSNCTNGLLRSKIIGLKRCFKSRKQPGPHSLVYAQILWSGFHYQARRYGILHARPLSQDDEGLADNEKYQGQDEEEPGEDSMQTHLQKTIKTVTRMRRTQRPIQCYL